MRKKRQWKRKRTTIYNKKFNLWSIKQTIMSYNMESGRNDKLEINYQLYMQQLVKSNLMDDELINKIVINSSYFDCWSKS